MFLPDKVCLSCPPNVRRAGRKATKLFQIPVCMKDQPGMVGNPARGQLTGKTNISLSPFAPGNLVSGDGFGSPVPRQPAHLHIQFAFCFFIKVTDFFCLCPRVGSVLFSSVSTAINTTHPYEEFESRNIRAMICLV